MLSRHVARSSALHHALCAGVAAFLTATGCLLLGTQMGNQDPKTLKAGSVHAKELVIEGPTGKAVARLKGTAGGAVLEFLGPTGKPRIVLKSDASGGARLDFMDADGTQRTHLGLATTGVAGLRVAGGKGVLDIAARADGPAVLRVHGQARRDMVLLGVLRIGDQENAAFQLQGARGGGLVLGVRGGGSPMFAMKDRKGAVRLLCGIDKSGHCGVQIRDSSGKAALRAYGRHKGEIGLGIKDSAKRERAVLGVGSDGQTKFVVKDKAGKVVAGSSK